MTRIQAFNRLILRQRGPGSVSKTSWSRSRNSSAINDYAGGSRLAPGSHVPPISSFEIPASTSQSGPLTTFSFSSKGKERERVVYRQENLGESLERRAYFSGGDDEGVGAGWGIIGEGEEEDIAGLEPGRVVECRRSGVSTIGLLLGSVISDGRPRHILLRQSGEIWPISSKEVQFVLPPSVVPPNLFKACWTPDLIAAWARGEDQSDTASEEMKSARRDAVVILRKVIREAERMEGRLSNATGGGLDGLWTLITRQKASEERGTITAAQVADHLLGLEEGMTRAHTLPAFAAHRMLMARPDMFVADDGDMWESGAFLVRSKGERARLGEMEKWSGDGTILDAEAVQRFIVKARKALSQSSSTSTSTNCESVEWDESDRTILSTLMLRLYETRSTQSSPTERLAIHIIRALDPYPGEIVDQSIIARLLTDLGVLPRTDSLQTSRMSEAVSREASQSPYHPSSLHPKSLRSLRSRDGLLNGTELDSLRQDFSDQTVWVIDDPTAKELDDGIAITPISGSEDVWVHIHVADPTSLLPLDHPLAVQASYRGSALYFPEGNTPLIPLSGAMSGLSLGASGGRAGRGGQGGHGGNGGEGGKGVLTFSCRLSADGQMSSPDVTLGWIGKPRVTTYADVDEAFGSSRLAPIRPFGPVLPHHSSHSSLDPGLTTPSPSPSPPISASEKPQLDLLRKLATARRAFRLRSAGIDFALDLGTPSVLHPSHGPHSNMFLPGSIPSKSTPYPQFPLIDYTLPPTGPTDGSLSANSAVAEMMMLAGRIAADFSSLRRIPIPYRGAAAPSALYIPGGQPQSTMSVEELLSHRDPKTGKIDPYTIWRSRVVFPASTIGSTPLPHWTMGFTGSGPGDEIGYTRATSPLRRYDDFLVHYQIKAYLAKQAGLGWGRVLDEGEMMSLAKRAAGAQKRVKRAAMTADLFWRAGLFGQRLKDPIEGASGVRRGEEGEGGKKGEVVDLRNAFRAKVSGQAVSYRGGQQTVPIHVPSLGAIMKLTTPPGRELDIGEEVMVRLEGTVQWPTPRLDAVLA